MKKEDLDVLKIQLSVVASLGALMSVIYFII